MYMELSDLIESLYSEAEELDNVILSNYVGKGSKWLMTYEYDDLYNRVEELYAKIGLYEFLFENEIELSN